MAVNDALSDSPELVTANRMQAAGSLKSKPAMKANGITAGCDRIRSIVRRRVTAYSSSAGEDQGEELLRLTLTLSQGERFTIHCTFQEPSLMTQR